MSMIKRGLGAVAAGILLLTAAQPAHAQARSWAWVKSYHPANATTWARCNADGRGYADGSTGYECKYFPNSYPPHSGISHYELWVGP